MRFTKRLFLAMFAVGALVVCACGQRTEETPPARDVQPHFVRRIDWIGQGIWLKADLHVHSRFSDGELTIAQVVDEAVRRGCDVLAVTDHGDANATAVGPEYFTAIEQARQLHPQLVLLAGLEWNVPPWRGREHATLLAPNGGDSRRLLGEFKTRFDDWERDNLMRDPQLALQALRWLSHQAIDSKTEPAIVLYNHPCRSRASSMSFADELALLQSVGPCVVGFEGAPGHQRGAVVGDYRHRLETIDRWDPAAAPGDAWDELLRRGVDVWGAVAGSDFHSRAGVKSLDYWPGEFAATWLYAPQRTAAGALAAIRAGAFFGVHGDIAREVQLSAEITGLPRPAVAGEAVRANVGEAISIRVEFAAPFYDWEQVENRIDEVELIVTTNKGTRAIVLALPGPGKNNLQTTLTVEPGGCALRARGRRKIAGDPDLMFYTNPIRILSTEGTASRTTKPSEPTALESLEERDR